MYLILLSIVNKKVGCLVVTGNHSGIGLLEK